MDRKPPYIHTAHFPAKAGGTPRPYFTVIVPLPCGTEVEHGGCYTQAKADALLAEQVKWLKAQQVAA